MREIEIKARIKNLDSLYEIISREGISLPKSISQIDHIFVLKPFKLNEIKKGSSPILRIRNEDNKYTLNLKKDITDQLDSLEYESEIMDVENMVAILYELGYHQVLEVRKLRTKFKLNDFKVCIDEVEKLGAFIELESMAEGSINVISVRAKMWNTLKNLSISEEDEVTKGYDRLLDEL